MTQVVILCGGKATRLYPVTKDMAKSMVEVCEKPFIYWQLKTLKEKGFNDIVLCTGYKSEQIKEYLDNNNNFGLNIKYSNDGDTFLGTGGAIKKAFPLLKDRFCVINGDSYLNYDYITYLYLLSGFTKLTTMAIYKGTSEENNVICEMNNITKYDKENYTDDMKFIDYGISIMKKEDFDIKKKSFDLTEVFQKLIKEKRLSGLEVQERFHEIGSFEGLEETKKFIGEDMKFIEKHLSEVKEIVDKIDKDDIALLVDTIVDVKLNNGRIFFLGVGGSAGSASHAVNDFRKISGIECYAPTDNVSELTARTNDDGWSSVFVNWLKTSKLNEKDAIFILSVGGGNEEKNISTNLVEAMKYALEEGVKILGIVGRDGGYTKKVANACVVIPTVNNNSITPHTEAFHGVLLHLLVSHPQIAQNETKWESTK